MCLLKLHFIDERNNWLAKHFIQSLLRLKPQDRLTSESAQLHPWILKYCPEARKQAQQLERAETERRKSMLTELKSLEAQQELEVEQDVPVNLVESVWVDGPKFNAKAQWKKAIHVIRTVNVMQEAVRTNSVKSNLNPTPLDSEDETA